MSNRIAVDLFAVDPAHGELIKALSSRRRGETIIGSHLTAGGYVTVDAGGFDRIPAFIA